jgi:hypothetical protein
METDRDAPNRCARINLPRFVQFLTQFAPGDLFENGSAIAWVSAIPDLAEAKSLHAKSGAVIPEPAIDLGDSFLDLRVGDENFSDPVGLDREFEDLRVGKDEFLTPPTIVKVTLQTEVTHPIFRKLRAVPFSHSKASQRLIDFNESASAAATPFGAEIRNVSEPSRADDFQKLEQDVFVVPVGGPGGERVKANPATLNRFVELDGDVAPSPEVGEFPSKLDEAFIEVVFGIEHGERDGWDRRELRSGRNGSAGEEELKIGFQGWRIREREGRCGSGSHGMANPSRG